MLIALGSAFIFLFPRSELTMAGSDHAAMQEQLKSATSIVLMLVPKDMRFALRLDENRFRAVSCEYQISSIPGPASDEILKIFKEGILKYQEGTRPSMEPRVAVFFRFANRLQQEFYFEDWGGRINIEGYSGKYRISALADFPTRLRALLSHPDVVLIKDRADSCPHS